MTPHIEANKGDYAETVLLPGDPLRAKWIAETFFDNPAQVNGVRNCLGYTGTYAGKKISVQAGDHGIRFLLVAGTPIQEPVAWHGPIVMNTREELLQAFDDLRNDRFIRPQGH